MLSCKESINDNPIENQAPETHLFLYADSTISQQKSKLQVHWWGDDKDGLVIGYLLKWEGIDNSWSFTKSNDSVFALPIGTVDTSFTFLVAAVDNSGNNKFDENVYLNGVDIGSEPFVDANNNGIYDEGEIFTDFGSIDDTPASQSFPIKNSSPEIAWNDASVLPERSFPTITIGWDAFDLDGNETIIEIDLALNDTSDFVTLSGSVRLVSLIIDDLKSTQPLMNVFINADANKLHSEKLLNLKLDSANRLYIRAVDNSGAKSKFVSLPDTGRAWIVEKPKGDLLLIDDYPSGEEVTTFYNEKFSTFASNSFNVFDLEENKLPYESVTFLNTIKLFKYVFWYSGSKPRMDFTNLITRKFLQAGGKIAYSLTFQDSSSDFDFSLQTVQSFLPVDNFDSEKPLSFLFPGANIISSVEFTDLPDLKTSTTIGFVRTFNPSDISSTKVYDLTSSQLNGKIALMNKTKNLFFIGLPLHQCDASGNVSELLQKIYVNHFGMN